MNIDDYQNYFEELINLEQDEEMQRHQQEMRSLTAREREAKGRCTTNMTIRRRKSGLRGEDRVTFVRADGDPLPELEITMGDVVQVARDQPLRSDNPTATVWDKSSRSLTLSLSERLPGWVESGPVRIDLMVDNVTYLRMLDALFVLPALGREKHPLRDRILGRKEVRASEPPEEPEWRNPNLNDSQREAVRYALGAENLFLVHGPPGTGKTVTMTEIIAGEVRRGSRVLAAAASNVAVDNMLDNLVQQGINALRIGHPARTTPVLRKHTLDYRVEELEEYQRSQDCREEALELVELRRDFTPPSGQWRRGLSDEQIHERAKQHEGARGVSPETMQEMATYLELSDRIDELFETCDRLEEEAINTLLERTPVVCTTNSTAGSDMLGGHDFDVVCIDEATQATEPSCLIPATKGEKLVMAGDHRQLPPTILNQEAAERGLDRTLFERLMEQWGDRISRRLEVQYRMHRDIMTFSSRRFYDGTLRAAPSVESHTLEDLPAFDPGSLESPYRSRLRGHPPLVWLDTRELPGAERRREGSTSAANPGEARVVTSVVKDYLHAGLRPEQLAVIAPYKDQVDDLRETLADDALEVDTVDGFQGREKEVVVLSLVRSNPEGEIGFLRDERRLNVSITRARRKLVLVGDGATVGKHPLYRALMEYVDETGDRWILNSGTVETDPTLER